MMRTRRQTKAQIWRATIWMAIVGTTALVGLPRAEAQNRIDYLYSPDPGVSGVDLTVINRAGTHAAGQWSRSSSGLWRATLWGPDGQPVDLNTDVFSSSYVTGISDDGATVVGHNTALAVPGAFRWTASGGVEYLGSLGGTQSWAYGVSGDGNTVIGRARRANFSEAPFVWISGASGGVAGNQQMYELPGLVANPNQTLVMDITRDARFIVGAELGGFWQAVRWDIGGIQAGNVSAIGLGTFEGMTSGYSQGYDISDDGRVVVGHSDIDGSYRAFRWVEGATGGVANNVQMYDLGTLGGDSSHASAVSGDGNVVVGQSMINNSDYVAYRWSEATGMIAVSEWLRRAGVDVGTNQPDSANDTSGDGSVVVGRMLNTDGEYVGYIARVADSGSGIMDVEAYHHSLFSTTQIANAGQFLAWLPMNGAHHRPLMSQESLSEDSCIWATGDLAHHGGSNTGLGLAEIGACVDLFGGNVRAGLGVGTSHSWQTLALGGSSRLAGQYAVGEVDWRPDGTPLLLSLTGMLGGWQANIHRGYSNGGTTAYSDGQTQLGAGVIRLRADWLEAASIGNTTINPWASVAVGRTEVGGYIESGGPFPAQFDARSLVSHEVRLGVTAVTEFSDTTTLSTTLEVAHRAGTAPSASGSVMGLFDFNLGGGSQGQTWARIGADLDQKIGENAMLSLSVHAATQGQDASIGGSIGFKAAF
ncbi:MAG: autotransporter domain-containing protein [Devosia sp.]